MRSKASRDLIDAITALDLQTMYDWRAGDQAPLDAEAQRAAVAKSLETGEAVTIWREDALAAYAVFVPRGQGQWFASGIALHPDLAGPGTIRSLRAAVGRFLARADVSLVESNVYKSNRKSVALHRRLGFAVTRENDFGLAFRAEAAALIAQIG
jgi:hypothetical protein